MLAQKRECMLRGDLIRAADLLQKKQTCKNAMASLFIVDQAGFELLTSSDPFTEASQSAQITGKA